MYKRQGIGGNSFGINLERRNEVSIPRLAEGGIVKARPGGILANIGEGGKDEAVIPLDRMNDFGGKIEIRIDTFVGERQFAEKIGDEIARAFQRNKQLAV